MIPPRSDGLGNMRGPVRAAAVAGYRAWHRPSSLKLAGALATVIFLGVVIFCSNSVARNLWWLVIYSPWLVWVLASVPGAVHRLRGKWRARRAGREGFAPILRALGAGARCPYCHDGLDRASLECDGCGAVFHRACLGEAGGCTTLGCERAPQRRQRTVWLG